MSFHIENFQNQHLTTSDIDNLLLNQNNLNQLTISNNLIESIENGCFNRFNNLVSLNLHQTKLKNLNATWFTNRANLKILNISCNLIERIEIKFFENLALESLDLHDNKVSWLEDGLFFNQSELKILNISCNFIETIDNNLFARLKKLEILDLHNNKLKRFEKNWLLNKNNLKKLDISSNLIESVDDNILENAKNLEELDLNNNKLSHLDSNWFSHNQLYNVTHLKILDVSNNSIDRMDPYVFLNLSNLENLNVNHNKLKRLEESWFLKKINLKILDFSFNLIENIDPNFFEKINDLESLNLNNNKISQVEKNWMLNRTQIKKFNLSFNSIETIDDGFFNGLEKLECLYLQHNKLKRLKECWFSYQETRNQKINKLRILDISYNFIDSIDYNFFLKLDCLESLELHNNKLNRFEDILFLEPNNIKKVDISSNLLEIIEINSFENLENLEILDLHNNSIRKIKESWFSKQKKLKKLDISKNFIRKIEENCFTNLNELENLHLNENQFNFIFYDWEKTKLNFIDLSQNLLENVYFKLNINISGLNLSFNKIKSADISVSYGSQLSIDLSSNKLEDCFSTTTSCLVIRQNPSNSTNSLDGKISINLRHNLIKEVSDKNEYISQMNALSHKIVFDLRNNLFSYSTHKLLEKFPKNFILKNTNYKFPTVFFDIHYEENHLIKSIEKWENLASFCLITGRNGIGKSTVLWYINETLSCLYKNIGSKYELSKYNSSISVFDLEKNTIKNIDESWKHLFIPVVYKMNETISTSIKLGDFDAIIKKLDGHEMEKENLIKTIEIFSSKSIDELILKFLNRKDYLNSHLPADFKYNIEFKYSNPDEIRVVFKDKIQGFELLSSQLSPGEQLIVLFYMWEFALTRFNLPHTPVLLLDEPDAHVHPKAVYDFVLILEKLADAGAQIIMTTHNPTTVSFVKKDYLYCMRERKQDNKLICIEKVHSKADAIRELTSNLLMINYPLRIVLVEGTPNITNIENECESVGRDALFYKSIQSILSESGISFQHQFFFKSFVGCDTIINFMKQLDAAKINLDYFGIIDNDNIFKICNNKSDIIEEFYRNIVKMSDTQKNFDKNVKNVLPLLRNSLENYVLDPINLFCYLNYIFQTERKIYNFEFDRDKIEKFYQSISSRMNSSQLKDFKKIVHIGQIHEKLNEPGGKELIQIIVRAFGEFLVDYLTKQRGLNYKLFSCRKLSFIQNLTPFLRWTSVNNLNEISENKKNKGSRDFFGYILAISKLLEIKDLQKYDFYQKWNSRLTLLKSRESESQEKNKEFEFLKKFQTDFMQRSKSLCDDYTNIRNKMTQCQEVYEELNFDEVFVNKADDEIAEKVFNFQFSEKNIEHFKSKGIESNHFASFIKLKYQLGKLLIEKIKQELKRDIECYFVGHPDKPIIYYSIFYLLNGHYLEELIQSIFSKSPLINKESKGKLVEEIVKENGLMKVCGYIIPNELNTILKLIDDFNLKDIPQSDSNQTSNNQIFSDQNDKKEKLTRSNSCQ